MIVGNEKKCQQCLARCRPIQVCRAGNVCYAGNGVIQRNRAIPERQAVGDELILVADDNQVLCQAIDKILKTADYARRRDQFQIRCFSAAFPDVQAVKGGKALAAAGTRLPVSSRQFS